MVKMKTLDFLVLILFTIINYNYVKTSSEGLEIASTPSNVSVCNSTQCIKAESNFNNSIDPSVNPCDDFYYYACGNWRSTGIDDSSGTLSMIYNINSEEILEFLKKNDSADDPQVLCKVRKMFRQCTKGGYLNKFRMDLIVGLLKEMKLPINPPVSSVPSPEFNFTYTIAKISKIFGRIIPFFGGTVVSNPYDQKTNVVQLTKNVDELILSALLNEANKEKNQSKCYCNDSTKCPSLFTFVNSTSSKDITELVEKYEDYLTLKSLLIAKEYTDQTNITAKVMSNVITVKELNAMTKNVADKYQQKPIINWNEYIRVLFEDVPNVTITDCDSLKIMTPEVEYVEDVLNFLHNNSMADHEFGLWYSVVTELVDMTDKDNVYGKLDVLLASTGRKSLREAACTEVMTSIMGTPIGYFYYTDPEYEDLKNRKNIDDLLKNIKDALKYIIREASWMDNATKTKGIQKVDRMTSYIGYPKFVAYAEKLDEVFHDVTVTDDFFETILIYFRKFLLYRLRQIYTINTLGRDKGYVSPTTVNAYYDPEGNTIYVPAAILRFPVYHNDLLALNYGAVGAIIGHEITHGFDNTGSRYNAAGTLENWWGNETLKAYQAKSSCFIEAYEAYNISGNEMGVNGSLTLGENIADNGGFKEAVLAYRKYVAEHGTEPLLHGYEQFSHEQLLSLNYGNVWCEVRANTPASGEDEHSPNLVRVNEVMMNSYEFAKIWNCPKGSPMNPDKKCEVW